MKLENIPESMEVWTKYNKFGDYIGHYDLPSKAWNASPLSMFPSEEVMSDLKMKIHHLCERGVKVLLLPPPYCESSYKMDSLSIACLVKRMKASDIPFCAKSEVGVYPDSLFYDSSYHLNKTASERHSKDVVKTLKELVIKEMPE